MRSPVRTSLSRYRPRRQGEVVPFRPFRIEVVVMVRRVLPAVGLFFLAPLVAEYLLGDFALTSLFLLLTFAPLYGGAALLVREWARRTGRGWTAMLPLALAYGVLEEGIATQSIWNKGYYHVMDVGYVPSLGTSPAWILGVLTIHTVWSIAVPILTVESLVGRRRTEPWLGRVGLTVVAVLFALGFVASTVIQYSTSHFVAPAPKLALTVVVVAALVVLAVRASRTATTTAPTAAGWVPNGLVTGVVALVLMSALHALPDGGRAWLRILATLVFWAVSLALLAAWSRRTGWGDPQRLGIAAGGLLAYAWASFSHTPLFPASPAMTVTSHVVFAAGAVALVVAAVLTYRRSQARTAAVLEGNLR